LGKRLLLRELAAGKLRQDVRVPLTVTDDWGCCCDSHDETPTGKGCSMPRQRAVGGFLAGGRKSTAPYLNQSAAKLNTALSRFLPTSYKKSCPF
jgi:hypothetical protein